MSFERPTDSEKKKIFENKLVSPASSINQTNGLQKTQIVDSSNKEIDFNLLNITIPNSLLLDGFGNLKTSQEANRFDAEFCYNTLEEIVDEVVGGSGIIEFKTTPRHALLSVVATSKNINASAQSLLGKAVLWDRKGSESGILTIAAIRTSSTSAAVLTSITWEELR